MIIWLTGLSGAGKSTLADALCEKMKADGVVPLMIDGDLMRLGLTADLGFGAADRSENVRRAAGVAVISARSGIISICSLISPLRKDREIVRSLAHAQGVPFVEIFVNTPLEVCEKRDPKGLYKKARSGQIPEFTGISSPYEPPLHPELVVATLGVSIQDSLKDIYRCISGLESYSQASKYSKMEQWLSRSYYQFKKITPSIDGRFCRAAPWILPPIYLILVLLLDAMLPIRTITNPLLAIGMMIMGITIRPKLMFPWTILYILTVGLILFCHPFYGVFNNSLRDFEPSVNGVRFTAFACTGIFSFLVSCALTRLRDRLGGAQALLPRVY
jgi:adenylyl-sulfate kinase